ncbi:hypothetical protein [Roseibium sp.]|uniref:hypothetical protein n=1 Tax=Roseibium sp. TaxID=1936156 RepID=UPI003B511A7F
MTIPNTFFTREALDCEGCHAWNDPRRQLYPHHAELWPEDLPEHVCFERQARKLRQKKQRALARAFFRFRWLGAAVAFARAPRWPGFVPEDPLERRPNRGPAEDRQTTPS